MANVLVKGSGVVVCFSCRVLCFVVSLGQPPRGARFTATQQIFTGGELNIRRWVE